MRVCQFRHTGQPGVYSRGPSHRPIEIRNTDLDSVAAWQRGDERHGGANITSIFYGRDFCYAVEQIDLDSSIENISATEQRKKLALARSIGRRIRGPCYGSAHPPGVCEVHMASIMNGAGGRT